MMLHKIYSKNGIDKGGNYEIQIQKQKIHMETDKMAKNTVLGSCKCFFMGSSLSRMDLRADSNVRQTVARRLLTKTAFVNKRR